MTDVDDMLLDVEAVQLGRRCVKCPKLGILSAVEPKKAVYCKMCFVQMVKHKFRSSLGKRRIFRDGAPKETLLVFDGSPSAALALGQLAESLTDGTHKKLMITPTVVLLITSLTDHIIDSIISQLNRLKSYISCDWYVVHLAAVLQNQLKLNSDSFLVGKDKIPEVSSLLELFESSSCRLEMIRILKERLASKIARQLEIGKVMFATNGDDLARSTITSFCMGRGGEVSDLTSVVEKRHGVMFIRPLHDICDKEVHLLNKIEGYDTYCIQDAIIPAEIKSVQKITIDFFDTLLKEGFKSTTTTVLSTASKVHAIVSGSERCTLCDILSNTPGYCKSCEEIRNDCSDVILFDSITDNIH